MLAKSKSTGMYVLGFASFIWIMVEGIPRQQPKVGQCSLTSRYINLLDTTSYKREISKQTTDRHHQQDDMCGAISTTIGNRTSRDINKSHPLGLSLQKSGIIKKETCLSIYKGNEGRKKKGKPFPKFRDSQTSVLRRRDQEKERKETKKKKFPARLAWTRFQAV